MVLRKKFQLALLTALLPALCLGTPAPMLAADAKVDTEVILPLAEYLSLVSRAEDLEQAQKARFAAREAPIAEVTLERIVLKVDENAVAAVDSFFEVLVQGEPIHAVRLPLPGFGEKVTIERLDARGTWVPAPSASLTAYAGKEGGSSFVTPEHGRFRISAKSRLAPNTSSGRMRLALLQVAAPVASAEIDLPADLEWISPGSVVVAEKVDAGRRQLRLATQRGTVPALQVWRRFEQGEEKALAHTVVLTIFQLRPEGLRRHDVLLYEVSRGKLSSFEITLPAGLDVEQVATDEGPSLPLAEDGHLRIDRQRQLQGTGYLVVTSTPMAGDPLPFESIEPAVEVRARYLAVSSSTAARIAPSPATSFSQIDLDDLPSMLGQALGAIRLAAAWRLQDKTGPLALTLTALPPMPSQGTTVRRRETTTLLTVDGTLLHRDSFTLAPSDRPASSFEITLPAGAVLWSTKVDDQPVRPLQRGGKIVLPIFARPSAKIRIEVVAVLEQAIAHGRSQLDIELARVDSPVLEQSWRLLLPDGPKYRFAGGDLEPVAASDAYEARYRENAKPLPSPPPPAAPLSTFGQLAPAEEITVIADAPLVDSRAMAVAVNVDDSISPRRRDELAKKREAELAVTNYNLQVGELQQGLVGGVKPLPITIPETGKALMLTGVLPPEQIHVLIDVKAKKSR